MDGSWTKISWHLIVVDDRAICITWFHNRFQWTRNLLGSSLSVTKPWTFRMDRQRSGRRAASGRQVRPGVIRFPVLCGSHRTFTHGVHGHLWEQRGWLGGSWFLSISLTRWHSRTGVCVFNMLWWTGKDGSFLIQLQNTPANRDVIEIKVRILGDFLLLLAYREFKF